MSTLRHRLCAAASDLGLAISPTLTLQTQQIAQALQMLLKGKTWQWLTHHSERGIQLLLRLFQKIHARQAYLLDDR